MLVQILKWSGKSCGLYYLLGKSGYWKTTPVNALVKLLRLFTIIRLQYASEHAAVSVASKEREEEKESITQPWGLNGQNRKAPRWQSRAWGKSQFNMLCFTETSRAFQWSVHSYASLYLQLRFDVMMLSKITQWREKEAPRGELARSLRMQLLLTVNRKYQGSFPDLCITQQIR